MKCMRCGKEVAEGQVFCPGCLEDMARYPVKPDTPIHLPPAAPAVQPRRQKKPKPQRKVDLIRRYRRWCKALAILLAVVLAVSAVAIIVLTQRLRRSEAKQNIGQNYTTTAPVSQTGN